MIYFFLPRFTSSPNQKQFKRITFAVILTSFVLAYVIDPQCPLKLQRQSLLKTQLTPKTTKPEVMSPQKKVSHVVSS